MNRSKGSKGSKPIKFIIIGLLLAASLLGYYYYLSNKAREAKEENVQATVVQSILMKDWQRSYPPTPKEVLKAYCEVTKCFYNEEYTDEELEQLAFKIQELYDEELIANKSTEDYLADLKSEIANMKSKKCTIVGYQISSSTDVQFFTKDGYSCASMYCTFSIKQAGQTVGSMEQFILRQDEQGHWKILGWDLVKE